MKVVGYFTIIIILLTACGKSESNGTSEEMINDTREQANIFNNLITVTDNTVSDEHKNDSLAFLVLPVQASCPSCRKKTIDSIVKHKDQLAANHFIIISAKGGRKFMNSYFREEDAEIPEIPGRLFLDSNNQAHKLQLYVNKPTMYYTHKQKAYKKVASVPVTVRNDLRQFFSGF